MAKTIAKNYRFDYSLQCHRQGKEDRVNLREARKNERYTQQQAADYLGISRPTYRRMEEDPGLVTIEDAKKLAELFRVSPEDIFFGSNCN